MCRILLLFFLLLLPKDQMGALSDGVNLSFLPMYPTGVYILKGKRDLLHVTRERIELQIFRALVLVLLLLYLASWSSTAV